jgi:hypothetical protein
MYRPTWPSSDKRTVAKLAALYFLSHNISLDLISLSSHQVHMFETSALFCTSHAALVLCGPMFVAVVVCSFGVRCMQLWLRIGFDWKQL